MSDKTDGGGLWGGGPVRTPSMIQPIPTPDQLLSKIQADKDKASSPQRQRTPAMPSGAKPESVTFPDQWPGVHCTDLGAVFDPDTVTVEVWKAFGRDMGALNRRTRLWLGDWIWYNGAMEFGFTLADMCEITGLELETLRSYESVGYKVPIANRILGPKPSLYATVAALPPDRQMVHLRRVRDEGLNRDELRRNVAPEKKAIRDAQIAAGLRPAGRPPKVIPLPVTTLADDMAKAASLIVPHNIEADRFATPLEFEGGLAGAKAFIASLPDNARVKIVVTHID